jgi:hypothetical protein
MADCDSGSIVSSQPYYFDPSGAIDQHFYVQMASSSNAVSSNLQHLPSGWLSPLDVLQQGALLRLLPAHSHQNNSTLAGNQFSAAQILQILASVLAYRQQHQPMQPSEQNKRVDAFLSVLNVGQRYVSPSTTPALQGELLQQRQAPLSPLYSPIHAQDSLLEPVPLVAASSLLSLGSQAPLDLPCPLACPEDSRKLSAQQVWLRRQIEAFRASEDDVLTHTRGRNKPIVLGQVGIRCRHCAHWLVSSRQKGSTYFPATLAGIYQAVQNMNSTHMMSGLCSNMSLQDKQKAQSFATSSSRPDGNGAAATGRRPSASGAGRPYWAKSAAALGLIDSDTGIRPIKNLPRETRIIQNDQS